MKYQRRFISFFLTFVLAMVPSIVSAVGPGAKTISNDGPVMSDTVDTNYHEVLPGTIVPMGTSKPTSKWNLSSKSYSGSATFKYALYTNYKYISTGKINISFTLDYVDFDPTDKVKLSIECWDADAGKVVTSWSITDHSPISSTVSFYNLDDTKYYYFYFKKTNDSEDAKLSFTVYNGK